VLIWEWPFVPARGPWARTTEWVALISSILGSVVLLFLVLDGSFTNCRFIHYLLETNTMGPAARSTIQGMGPRPGAPPIPGYPIHRQADESGGTMFYYPCLIFFLFDLVEELVF